MPRIPDLDNALIKRLLDSGADGIIAPSIENVEQIEFLENSIFYPLTALEGMAYPKLLIMVLLLINMLKIGIKVRY